MADEQKSAALSPCLGDLSTTPVELGDLPLATQKTVHDYIQRMEKEQKPAALSPYPGDDLCHGDVLVRLIESGKYC